MLKHLWEPTHPYACSTTNYFDDDCRSTYSSWATFLKAEGDSDLDLNLVFRWDWDVEEGELALFFIGQRRGIFRSVTISNMCADDELSVREWLAKRWAHLRTLWTPLSEC